MELKKVKNKTKSRNSYWGDKRSEVEKLKRRNVKVVDTVYNWCTVCGGYGIERVFYCLRSRKNGGRRCWRSCQSCLVRKRWLRLTTVRRTGLVNRTVAVDQSLSVRLASWCMLPQLYKHRSTGCLLAFPMWKFSVALTDFSQYSILRSGASTSVEDCNRSV